MPALLTFYDAAYPPESPPLTDGVCFYIGGNTPHVWSRAEIAAQRARYRLPVYVRSNTAGASAAADAAVAVAQLRKLSAPRGCLVAWDVETAEDPGYISAVHQNITAAGYQLIVYGSESTVLGNENPSGLYWGAQWTGVPHLAWKNSITQYIAFQAYDESVALASLPFWDTHSTASLASWQERLMQALPVVRTGATGVAVRTVQGLCCARGRPTTIDGDFGPQTELAVRAVQEAAKISVDGIVGPSTWPALMGI